MSGNEHIDPIGASDDGLLPRRTAPSPDSRRRAPRTNRYTKRTMLSFLTVVSVASLTVTLLLAQATDKRTLDMKSNDALSFRAPHLQQSDGAPATGPISLTRDEGELPRRNLSEAEGNATAPTADRVQTIKASFGNKGGARQRQQPKQQQQGENKDQRPSGVVYQYIPPPEINATARTLLHSQFPNLADIDSKVSAALCGIVKDAEPYLDEWVDYHFGLGFHTIYLIDNSKDHELKNWQDRRRAAGYSVRVMPKPGSHRQMYGYHMCAAEHNDEHTWMAFFDVDEFLVLKKHDTVNEFLMQHLRRGSLAISWYIFGTGFRDVYAPLPVTKRFMYRDGLEKHERHPQWHNVKSIMLTADYDGYPKSPHSMKTKGGTTWVDTNGKGSFDKIGSSNNDRPVDVAVLHHYKYLSPKEYYWKTCIRKTVDDKFKDCDNLRNKGPPFSGRIYDDSAWRMLKKNVPRYAMFDQFDDFL